MITAGHLARPLPAWDAEADDRLVCRAILQETHDVRSFVFTAPEPRLFHYTPGQFLTFTFPTGAEPLQRSYTLATSPTRPHAVGITVKRSGPVSTWLHERLRVGDTVQAVGPLGDFSSWLHPRPKLLFLSGGSGITPLMSMLRAYADLGMDEDLVFLHAARTPADIVFRRELESIAARHRRLQLAFVVERADGESAWAGHRGRLNPALLTLVAPDLLEREVFCCGPAPFMGAARAALAERGFAMAGYHEESFDFALLGGGDLADERTVVAAATVPSFTVRFAKSGREIACRADQTVLAAARAAGIPLPASCTRGLCGTCKSKLTEGRVDMTHQGGIRQREIDQGLALLCCSRPLSDLVVER